MSFKDLQVQSLKANVNNRGENSSETEWWKLQHDQDLRSDSGSESKDAFEDTSKFGFYQAADQIVPIQSGKLTFRENLEPFANNHREYSEQTITHLNESQKDHPVESTPKKSSAIDSVSTDLQKKPSLVFRSGRREIIYFEDPEENSEYGDLAASIQNSSRVKQKREKKVPQSEELAKKIIGQLRAQGNDVDEKALIQSIDLILRMPPS